MCSFLYLKGLNEGPKQNANGPTLPQELNETGCSEESQKTQVYEVFLNVCRAVCRERRMIQRKREDVKERSVDVENCEVKKKNLNQFL